MKAVFTLASKISPSVVFVDEVSLFVCLCDFRVIESSVNLYLQHNIT